MAEKEYIEREAMVEIITMLKSEIGGKCMMDDETLLYFIKKMPAADVAPVKHGRWIEQEGWAPGDYYYTCSVCGEDYNTIDGSPDYNFCPNCGCKMDLTGGEQE